MARNRPPKRNPASLRDRSEMIGGEMRETLRQSDALVERLRPILAGQSPKVQGAAIAQLLASLPNGNTGDSLRSLGRPSTLSDSY